MVAFFATFGISSQGFVFAESERTAETKSVAGKTLQQNLELLAGTERAVRLRAIRSIGLFGQPAGDALLTALDHQDAAVRYIAAEHLGRLGGEALEKAKARLRELADDESSLAVRTAASYALCRGGDLDKHLPLLIKTLDYPERGMVCSTAALLAKIGPPAKAAIGPLEKVHAQHRSGVKGGDYHIGGAAMNALREIREN
ncbi:MAG: HEAT repeat domain-containing protein [Rubripirellula sp.]